MFSINSGTEFLTWWNLTTPVVFSGTSSSQKDTRTTINIYLQLRPLF